MKLTLTIGVIFFFTIQVEAQQLVEWSKGAEITRSSFKAKPPNLAEDNVQQYSFAASFDFSFNMASIQFAFTKNFNQYVSASYDPSLSWIEEGNMTDQLLLMANLDFDLVELYARKFRKRIFETKNVGSNVDFYNGIYAEIKREYTDKQAVIQSELSNQENVEKYLNLELEKVNQAIDELYEFCKSCKPKKRKKKKKKR